MWLHAVSRRGGAGGEERKQGYCEKATGEQV